MFNSEVKCLIRLGKMFNMWEGGGINVEYAQYWVSKMFNSKVKC